MGAQALSFELPSITVDGSEAIEFATRFDPNAAHTGDGNTLVGGRFVSGLYVLALVNRELLRHPMFVGEILAAEIEIKFSRPVRPGSRLMTSGWTERRPSASRPGSLVVSTRALVVIADTRERALDLRVIHLMKHGA